jgi:hypothetical protein
MVVASPGLTVLVVRNSSPICSSVVHMLRTVRALASLPPQYAKPVKAANTASGPVKKQEWQCELL